MFPNGFTEDVVLNIATFFDLRSLLVFSSLDKFTFDLVERIPRLWLQLTERILPGYFTHSSDGSRCSIMDSRIYRRRLQHWTDQQFSFQIIGEMSGPRFLSRSCSTQFRGRYIVFGGEVEDRTLSNKTHITWFSDEESKVYMSEVTITTNVPMPSPRKACAMCQVLTDDGREHILAFGGVATLHEGAQQAFLVNDLWHLSLAHCVDGCDGRDSYSGEWTQLQPAFPMSSGISSPRGRWGHSMVSYKSFIILFGGSCPGDIFNDIWIIDCRDPKYTWFQGALIPLFPYAATSTATATVTNLPHPRGGHSAVIIGTCMYVYGGNTIGRSFDDLWRIDISILDSYHVVQNSLGDYYLPKPLIFPCEEVHATGDSPPAGIGHVALVVGNNMLLYGGRNFYTRQFNPNVYIFDTLCQRWRVLVDSIAQGIANRTGHFAFPCNSGVVFFGGATQHEISKSVIHLNLFGTSHLTSSSASVSASIANQIDFNASGTSFLLGTFETGLCAVIGDSISMAHSESEIKTGITDHNGEKNMYSFSFEEIC